MSMSNGLLTLPALLLLATLTGCASSLPQVATQQPAPPVVDGAADESTRTVIQSTDQQIYQSEHAMDPDAPPVSPAQNQGIP